MAQFAGQIANAEHGGQGNAFVLTFPGTPTEVLFNRGVETGLRETAPGVNLIGYGSGFQLQDSQAAVQQVLDSGQPISLIIAITDRAAFGAIAALEAAGIPPDSVAIVSASGDIRAQEYIREGRYIRGTLMVNRAQGSTVLFNGLVKLLAGSSVPEVLYTTPGEMLTRDSLNNTDSPPVTDSTSQ
jgi:ABC-type sugar transport system substrate-binding protein